MDDDLKDMKEHLDDLVVFMVKEGAIYSSYNDPTRDFVVCRRIFDMFSSGQFDYILFGILKEDLPLHINSIFDRERAVVKWRLHHGI